MPATSVRAEHARVQRQIHDLGDDNERVGIAVHADGATDQPLIGIKEALPQCMRNDRDAYRRTKAVILRGRPRPSGRLIPRTSK